MGTAFGASAVERGSKSPWLKLHSTSCQNGGINETLNQRPTLVTSPFASTPRFPRSTQLPLPGSAHLYPGCRSVRKQVSPELIPESSDYPGFDIVLALFDTKTVVPLRSSSWKSPDPIRSGLFLLCSLPRPLPAAAEVVGSLLLQDGSEGPAFINYTVTQTRHLSSARLLVAHSEYELERELNLA